MNRTIKALALCGLALLFSAQANAQVAGLWRQIPLGKRVSVASVNRGGYRDSLNGWGRAAPTFPTPIDTLTPFSRDELGIQPVPVGADSLFMFKFEFYPMMDQPTGAATVSADSLWVQLQGSWDGATWVGGPDIAILAATGVYGLSVSGTPSTNAFMRNYSSTRFGGSAGAVTNANMGMFDQWRFLIHGDHAGWYKARVWVAVDPNAIGKH